MILRVPEAASEAKAHGKSIRFSRHERYFISFLIVIEKDGTKQVGKSKIVQRPFKIPRSADPLISLPRFPFRILPTILANFFLLPCHQIPSHLRYNI